MDVLVPSTNPLHINFITMFSCLFSHIFLSDSQDWLIVCISAQTHPISLLSRFIVYLCFCNIYYYGINIFWGRNNFFLLQIYFSWMGNNFLL